MKATLVVIENEDDHAEAKALVEKLMRSEAPQDASRLAAQARLMEAYERSRWPRKTPKVGDILNYLMDQNGLTRSDLIPLLGSESRVSEVLNGKRQLSLNMIQRLRQRFRIPADVLLPPPNSDGTRKYVLA